MSTTDPLSAVRDALKGYLATYLASSFPSLVVSSGWPTPGKSLGPQALTVTLPMAVPRVSSHLPRKVDFVPIDADTGTYTYSYGLADVGLQLDLWTQREFDRNALVQAIQAALNRPPAATLGLTVLPGVARQQGAVLRVPEFYNAPASYLFDHFPSVTETSSAVQAASWRAMWTGNATLFLLSQEAVAILKSIVGKFSFNGGAQSNVPLSE